MYFFIIIKEINNYNFYFILTYKFLEFELKKKSYNIQVEQKLMNIMT